MHFSIRSLALALGLGALAVSSPVQAGPPDADVARIVAAGHSLDWTWTPPGRNDHFGHGETLVHAPIDAVRRVILDFGKYKDLPDNSIKTSRVVSRGPDGTTDVYFQINVLNDILKLWNVTRFAPLRHEPDGAEVVEGKMVPGKGNVDDAALVWTLRAVGPEWTLLKADALLRPSLPAPQSVLDRELRQSAVNSVNSVRDQLQGVKGLMPFSG